MQEYCAKISRHLRQQQLRGTCHVGTIPGSNKMHTNCSQEDEDQDKSYFILHLYPGIFLMLLLSSLFEHLQHLSKPGIYNTHRLFKPAVIQIIFITASQTWFFCYIH